MVYNYVNADNRVIELIDLNGRVISSKRSNALATRMETGAMPNGLYILKITDNKDKTVRTEKIIIQH
jgi:hypothetical protein